VCGRYTNTAGIQELNERFKVPFPDGDAGTHRYNVAPTEEVLAIVAPKGEPQARLLRWGLVPTWADDVKIGNRMINAKMETVTERPAFRNLIGKGSRRALQIADGYYEWLKPEQRGHRSKIGQPQPFLFRVDGGAPFAFAALWTPAKIGGEWIESIVLLTCDSATNRVAAAIHDRMPVVLADSDAQRAWLDADLDAEEALALCGPLPQSRLTAAPANPALNKPGAAEEGPELLHPPSTS
jgi:putative SOS response-associated peptidase YedK